MLGKGHRAKQESLAEDVEVLFSGKRIVVPKRG